MGQGRSKGRKKEASGVGKELNPWEWGETLGSARPPEWTPRSTEWERRRGAKASGVEENPGRGRHGVGGEVESSQDDSTLQGEGGGGQIVSGRLDPQRKGWLGRFVARRLNPKRNGRGGVESS